MIYYKIICATLLLIMLIYIYNSSNPLSLCFGMRLKTKDNVDNLVFNKKYSVIFSTVYILIVLVILMFINVSGILMINLCFTSIFLLNYLNLIIFFHPEKSNNEYLITTVKRLKTRSLLLTLAFILISIAHLH